jgi:hypothetical protein
MCTVLGMLDSLRSSRHELLTQVGELEANLPGGPTHPAPPEVRLLCAAGIRQEVARLLLVGALLGEVASWGSGQDPDLYREAGLTSARSKGFALLLHSNGYARCVNIPGMAGIVRIEVTPEQLTQFFHDLELLIEALSDESRPLPDVGFLNVLYDGRHSLFSNFALLAQRLKHTEFATSLRDSIHWYTEECLPDLYLHALPTDYQRVRLAKSVLEDLKQLSVLSNGATSGGLLTGSYDHTDQCLTIDGFRRVPTSPNKHFTYDWKAYHRLVHEASQSALVVGEWHSHTRLIAQ